MDVLADQQELIFHIYVYIKGVKFFHVVKKERERYAKRVKCGINMQNTVYSLLMEFVNFLH